MRVLPTREGLCRTRCATSGVCAAWEWAHGRGGHAHGWGICTRVGGTRTPLCARTHGGVTCRWVGDMGDAGCPCTPIRERGTVRTESNPYYSVWGQLTSHLLPLKLPPNPQRWGGWSSGGQQSAGMGWCWRERFKAGIGRSLLTSLCSSLPELFDCLCINSQ